MTRNGVFLFLFTLLHLLSLFAPSHSGFHSDELLVDDDELVLDGVQPQPQSQQRSSIPKPDQTATPSPTPRRKSAESDSDSKIQFTLEHAFGDSDFVPAGTFSARLKTSAHGGQTLTKLRFSRNDLTDTEKENFKNLLEVDDFYKIRLPSNVLSPPGKDFVVSSVKARCLPRETLDEHFVIQTEGVNILAVNYGAPGACSYPRQMKLPSKWLFNSYTVLKNTEQAPRTPVFIQDVVGGEEGEGEAVQPPERTWWAKYWMYLIPLGLIVMNAMTQAMNAPEEQQSAGQPGGAQTAAVPRGPSSAARRR
ncbi:ER membrane protein complex subunit 10 [Linum perenne]